MGNWHVNGAELFTANGKMNVEDKFAASRLEPKVVTVRLQAESRQCLIYEYLKLRINQFYIDTNSTEQKPEVGLTLLECYFLDLFAIVSVLHRYSRDETSQE
uniref:Uncharacterized protein n=1 Tax=Vespula pensylvanica TaxID=30213 RepID=A0A834UI27_VESPE|nr:hypothetical protein H0235_002015 [Vespula pensylvanica]